MTGSGERLAEWLTLERALYAVAAAGAVLVRLIGLDWWGLGPAEAAQALPAWEAAAGRVSELSGASPLLHGLQRATFTAVGASDAAARWWPALLGGLSVLLFYALRDRLTRSGALAAAFLWALSPVAVFTSRLGLGYGLTPALALALLAALNAWAGRALEAGKPFLRWAAAMLGLLLISGPGAYTVLAVGLVALAWLPGGPARLWAAAAADRRAVLVSFLAPLLLGATFFLTEIQGLAAAAAMVGAWLSGLVPGPGAYRTWDILQRLLLSEPLLLVAGLAGGLTAWRQGDRAGQWASAAAALALIVPLVGRGRHPGDLALAVLALTLLAGPAVAKVLHDAREWRTETDPWLLLGVSAALLIAALICLPSAFNPANRADWRQVYTGVGIGAALVAVLVWGVYAIWGSARTVARVLPALLLALGLAWSAGQMVSLSYERGAGRQAGALVELAAPDAELFRATLRNLSAAQGGGGNGAAVDLVWPERTGDAMLPVLRWLLREMPALRITATVPSDPAKLVITAQQEQPKLSARYGGADFALIQRWRSDNLGDFYAHLRWVLYRETGIPPEKLGVILWVDRGASAGKTDAGQLGKE